MKKLTNNISLFAVIVAVLAHMDQGCVLIVFICFGQHMQDKTQLNVELWQSLVLRKVSLKCIITIQWPQSWNTFLKTIMKKAKLLKLNTFCFIHGWAVPIAISNKVFIRSSLDMISGVKLITKIELLTTTDFFTDCRLRCLFLCFDDDFIDTQSWIQTSNSQNGVQQFLIIFACISIYSHSWIF